MRVVLVDKVPVPGLVLVLVQVEVQVEVEQEVGVPATMTRSHLDLGTGRLRECLQICCLQGAAPQEPQSPSCSEVPP
jgi:CMP-2-keto-3-deoxyoctulosonic acid synthetase